MKYASNFGESPRYKTLGELPVSEKDLMSAVRVDYDPKTGKITPKLDVKNLQKQIIKSAIDKIKDEVKNKIQSEVLKQVSSQIAAMYAKYVVPGLQIIGAIDFAIKSQKNIGKILDLAGIIYGKKLIEHLNKVFFGGFGAYRDKDVDFNTAAETLFNWTFYDAKYVESFPGYIEQVKIFREKLIHVPPSLRLLQFYPYFEGTKSLMSIINEMYPELSTLPEKARYTTAMEMGMLLSNSIEEPLMAYYFTEEKKLSDGKIEISVSSEFQKELDDVVPLFMGDDSAFFYEVLYYTNSEKNIPPEFQDRKYLIDDSNWTYRNSTEKYYADKHKVRFDFVSSLNAPDEIRAFVDKMNYAASERFKIIQKQNDKFVELPIAEYLQMFSSGSYIDLRKIPGDVYIIRDKRISNPYNVWPYQYAKDREKAIIESASKNVFREGIDLKAIDPLEEHRLLTENPKYDPLKNSLVKTFEKFSPGNSPKVMTYYIKSSLTKALEKMDATKAKVFMKTLETYPYPFKGLSHKFYFNRVNKLVDAEMEVIKKKNQRMALGVAGVAILGYLATQD